MAAVIIDHILNTFLSVVYGHTPRFKMTTQSVIELVKIAFRVEVRLSFFFRRAAVTKGYIRYIFKWLELWLLFDSNRSKPRRCSTLDNSHWSQTQRSGQGLMIVLKTPCVMQTISSGKCIIITIQRYIYCEGNVGTDDGHTSLDYTWWLRKVRIRYN